MNRHAETLTLRARLDAFRMYLAEPVDGASVGFFRVAFGLLLAVAAARFFVHGWIDKYYATPKVFFSYWGFSWVRPLPGIGMPLVYATMGLSALGLAWGRWHRLFAASTLATFTFAHLSDKTNYLNHYYLVTLVLGLLVVLPVGVPRGSSGLAAASVPRATVWLLRFQIGCVYFFGGVAKLKGDWLFHAQPLGIWLSSNAGMAVLGPLFAYKATAFAMSWAGAAYDLTVPFFLSFRRTRPFAYVAVVVFHVLTAKLFQIGMFPWIMIASSLLFMDPSWPRRVPGLKKLVGERAPVEAHAIVTEPLRVSRPVFAVLIAYVALQGLLPLRHLLYSGNVLWTEDGFRFAWNVMLIEKNGSLELDVKDPATGRKWTVEPHDYLTPQQAKQMSTQPDMILQFAHIVRDDFAARGIAGVEIRASQSDVSLNGRRPQRLVDPNVDLAREKDTLGPKRFVLPAPTSAPLL